MNSGREMVRYSCVNRKSSYYEQAVELRYRTFFEPESISLDAVYDNVEGESIHLVAHIGENVVGYGRLTICSGESQISQMVVDPAYRGRGLGTEIMRILINKSTEAEVIKIFLNARTNAVGFYEHVGFMSIGHEFPSRKTGIPHIRMEKTIERT